METPILRRHSVLGESYNPESVEIVYIPYFPKNSEDDLKIRDQITNHFLFQSLDEDQIKMIVNAMETLSLKKNEIVYKEGDVGQAFYVVKSGCFGLYCGGILNNFKDKGFFGEISLMYESSRMETVTALTDGILWKLDRFVFRRIVVTDSFRKRTFFGNILTHVPTYKSLTKSETNKILDALQHKTYEDGDLITSGRLDGMVFVGFGEVSIFKNEEKVREYKKGEFFGDPESNFDQDERAVASGNVRVAYLETERVERLLGPLNLLKNPH